MALLSAEDIVAGYDNANVLRGVSITLEAGEIVAVVGRNGVGKTTLMRALIGLLPLRGGRVTFDGQEIGRESADRRARRGIGYVPQGRGIFPQLTVLENLRMGGYLNAQGPAPDLDMAIEIFPVLKNRLGQRGGTLSGGQQAMLAIARAVIRRPKLLLLDEPSDGVQPSIVQEIGAFLQRHKREGSMAILLVEQNIELMQTTAERAYALDKGSVTGVLSGSDLKDEMIIATHVVV